MTAADTTQWIALSEREAVMRAEIERLTEGRDTMGNLWAKAKEEIERLRQQNEDLRRWKALDKPYAAAMKIVRADYERRTAALNEIVALDHYPDATIARRALGLPTTDREDYKP